MALLLLAACASSSPLALKNEAAARAPGFSAKTYAAGFQVFTLQKLSDTAQPIRVYLEGDGNAYLNSRTASPNPTPLASPVLDMALRDTSANVVYIARPCQYTQDARCEEKYWTLARFAPEIITAVAQVIAQLPNAPLELIGYSGGAEVMVLLAAGNPQVRSLRSVAGNLDHTAFTRLHGSTPLAASLDPTDAIRKLSHVPQIHFVGAEDETVPLAVAHAYRAKQEQNTCTQIITIPQATHQYGWVEKWPALLARLPVCN